MEFVFCSLLINLNSVVFVSVGYADVGITIVNGTEAFPGQFPYMAAIRVSIFTDYNFFFKYSGTSLTDHLNFKTTFFGPKIFPIEKKKKVKLIQN